MTQTQSCVCRCGSGTDSLQCVIDPEADEDTYNQVKSILSGDDFCKLQGNGNGNGNRNSNGDAKLRTCSGQQCGGTSDEGDSSNVLVLPRGTSAPCPDVGTAKCPAPVGKNMKDLSNFGTYRITPGTSSGLADCEVNEIACKSDKCDRDGVCPGCTICELCSQMPMWWDTVEDPGACYIDRVTELVPSCLRCLLHPVFMSF